MQQNLVLGIHGEAKAGKTTFASKSPQPILFFDAENASKFLFTENPGDKVYWNPITQPMPIRNKDNLWKAVVVIVESYEHIEKALEELRSQPHPFRTIVFDSISEIQDKLSKSILRGKKHSQLQLQDWGAMASRMGELLRAFRDLPVHADSPLVAVVFLAMSKTPTTREKDGSVTYGKTFPVIRGSAKDLIVYMTDLMGHLYYEVSENWDDSVSAMVTKEDRGIIVGKHESFVTANRVVYNDPKNPGKTKTLPDVLPGNTTVTGLLKIVFPELREYLDLETDDPRTFTPGYGETYVPGQAPVSNVVDETTVPNPPTFVDEEPSNEEPSSEDSSEEASETTKETKKKD